MNSLQDRLQSNQKSWGRSHSGQGARNLIYMGSAIYDMFGVRTMSTSPGAQAEMMVNAAETFNATEHCGTDFDRYFAPPTGKELASLSVLCPRPPKLDGITPWVGMWMLCALVAIMAMGMCALFGSVRTVRPEGEGPTRD